MQFQGGRAGLVGQTPSKLDLQASNSHKMKAPPAAHRSGGRNSLDRSYSDVMMAIYDSDSEPLAKRSTKAIKKRRKSLKRLSLNTQRNNRDERAKKRRR